MSKSKKESYIDSSHSNALRRTIANTPSSSRRSEDYGSYSGSTSSSSDSSPDRKKKKYGKPHGRGSETGIVFDNDELKKFSITIKNKSVKPPKLHISNPEDITPIRRPGEHARYQEMRRRNSSTSDSRISSEEERSYNFPSHDRYWPVASRQYVPYKKDEGKRPLFDKVETKERSLERSPEARNSSSHSYPIEHRSRRKRSSTSRQESPGHRGRRSRKESPPPRKHRRSISSPSRHSSSSDSSSSSEERSRKKYYYKLRAEREEKERRRKEYERELYIKEMRLRERRAELKVSSHHSNGGKLIAYSSRERAKESSSVYSSSRPKEPPLPPYPRERSSEPIPYPSYSKERPKEPSVPYPYSKELHHHYSRERPMEELSEEEEDDDEDDEHHHIESYHHHVPPHLSHQPQGMVRAIYPMRLPPPVPVVHPSVVRAPLPGARPPVIPPPHPHSRPLPYILRPGLPVRGPMRPFVPPGMPGYPPPVGYYPRPRLPVPFRPMIRHPPRPPPRVFRPT